jgi:hypothetical protein
MRRAAVEDNPGAQRSPTLYLTRGVAQRSRLTIPKTGRSTGDRARRPAVSALRPGGTSPDEMPAHSFAPDVEVADGSSALKQCIDGHGPITQR